MSAAGFIVWVTGPGRGACERIGEEVAARLGARHVAVELLGGRTPGIHRLPAESADSGLVLAAAALARHGVVSVVAATGPGEAARAEVPHVMEVWVHGDGPTPPGYRAPERPEVEVVVPESAPGGGAERTLRTLEVLGFIARDEQAYSPEEEREVIRRLKAFGYL
jgi:hypothetical protein